MPIRTVYDNGEFPGGRERPSPAYLSFKADKRLVLNPGDLTEVRAVKIGNVTGDGMKSMFPSGR